MWRSWFGIKDYEKVEREKKKEKKEKRSELSGRIRGEGPIVWAYMIFFFSVRTAGSRKLVVMVCARKIWGRRGVFGGWRTTFDQGLT